MTPNANIASYCWVVKRQKQRINAGVNKASVINNSYSDNETNNNKQCVELKSIISQICCSTELHLASLLIVLALCHIYSMGLVCSTSRQLFLANKLRSTHSTPPTQRQKGDGQR